MTWVFVGAEKGLEPIPGLPLEATDELFAEAVAAYEGEDGRGSVEASGLYVHIGAPAPVEDVAAEEGPEE